MISSILVPLNLTQLSASQHSKLGTDRDMPEDKLHASKSIISSNDVVDFALGGSLGATSLGGGGGGILECREMGAASDLGLMVIRS